MPRSTRNIRPVPTAGERLTKVALVVMGVGLVVSMLLGFSEKDWVNRAGTAIFFLVFIPGVLLLIVAAALRIAAGLRSKVTRRR